jgi:hypothetical protein
MPQEISSLTPQGIQLLQQQSDIKAQEDRRKEAREMFKIEQQKLKLREQEGQLEQITLQENIRQNELQRQHDTQLEQKRQSGRQELQAGEQKFVREMSEEEREANVAQETRRYENNVKVMEKEAEIMRAHEQEERAYKDQVRREAAGDAIALKKLTVKSEYRAAIHNARVEAALISANQDEEKQRELAKAAITRRIQTVNRKLQEAEVSEQRWTAFRSNIRALA